MRRRFWTFAVLFALVMTAVPANAKLEYASPFDDPQILLDEDEAAKLQQLQDVSYPGAVTEISPDDTTIVVGSYRYSDTGGIFLNVVDGSIVPIKPLVIPEGQDFYPIAATELVWFDNNTVGQLILDLFSGSLLYVANRYTGEVSLIPVNTGDYFPISLAPNGSRMFAVRIADMQGMRLAQTLKSPFTVELPKLSTSFAPLKQQRTGFYAHTDQQRRMNEQVLELAIVDLNSGEATALMNLPENSLLWSYAWSQDGSKFALIRDTVEYSNGATYKRLVDAAVQDALGGISPQDNPFFIHNVVDTFDLATGDFRIEAFRAADGNGDIARNVAWSSDGNRYLLQMEHPAQIAGRPHPTYLFTDRHYLRFYSTNGDMLGEYSNDAINTPEATGATFISPDEVLINTAHGMSRSLYYYNQGSGEFRQISQQAGTYYTPTTTRQSRQLIFGYTSFSSVPDVYRLGWDGQALARLTWSNGELEKISNVRVDSVSFTLRNGAVREGFLIQPADASFPPKNVPLVFWQEGGPRVSMTQYWAANVENPYNLLPNFGIAVLYVPLVGRLGFGPERLNALADGNNFGQIDIDEGEEIVAQVVAKGWAANNNVGVTGCSYGGYFAAQSITRHPQRYAAANPQCTLLDNSFEFNFGIGPLIAYLEGSTPMDNASEYAEDSPLARASRVRTPTLLFHGSYDFLPIKYAVDFHDQIEIQKYTAKLIEFGDEGHGLLYPENQFRAAQEQIIWFRTYLAADASMAEAPVEQASTNTPTTALEQTTAAPALVEHAVAQMQPATTEAQTIIIAAPRFVSQGKFVIMPQ